MAKKVVVERIGQTDTYHNASVAIHPDGSVSVTSGKRPMIKVTYAHGRWIAITEEGQSA